MDPAYYVAAGSLKARSFQLETISNNLANSATVGYKTERSFFSLFNKAAASDRNLPLTKYVNDGTVLAHRSVDFSQGATRPTGRPLDLAVEGNAFFMVQTPQGNQATRDGRFQIGSNGILQTEDGLPILGKNDQPLKVNPTGGTLTISPDGTLQQGTEVVGQLGLKSFANPSAMQRVGSNRYDVTGLAEAPVKGMVAQGYLEQSAVDVASCMVDMIQMNRLFEMSMKVASAITNDLDNSTITNIANQR